LSRSDVKDVDKGVSSTPPPSKNNHKDRIDESHNEGKLILVDPLLSSAPPAKESKTELDGKIRDIIGAFCFYIPKQYLGFL